MPPHRFRAEPVDASRITSLLADVNQPPPANNLTDWDHIGPLVEDMNIAFRRLDRQHRGLVTNQQLAELMENQHLSGADAATAAALYKINKELQSGDIKIPVPANPNGLSSQELQQVIYKANHARPDAVPPADQSFENITVPDLWAEIQFTLTHKDAKTDKVTLADIDKSIATTIGDAETKKSLNFFKQHYAEIATGAQHGVDDGVTFQEVENFARKYSNANDAFYALRNIISNHSEVLDEKIPTRLYSASKPEQSISHLGVEQRLGADCYFESPLASTADLHKSWIAQMIKANSDGTMTVTFRGQSQSYTVSKPTEAERILFNKGAKAGDWGTVIEKAYGLWTQDPGRQGAVQKKDEVPEEYSNHAGYASVALSALTNSNVQPVAMAAMGADYVKQHLLDAQRDGRVIVVDRQRGNFAADELVDLPTAHVYSVMNFEPTGANGGTVTLWNPYGRDVDDYGGTFKMPLNQFVKSFASMFEEPGGTPLALLAPLPKYNFRQIFDQNRLFQFNFPLEPSAPPDPNRPFVNLHLKLDSPFKQ
ncbi:MAG TPA: hypothetical protein V6C86_26810 [Oculatellaceae cyanobacterium]